MKKIVSSLIVFLLISIMLLIMPKPGIAAGECDLYANHSAQGIFENFQSHEYVNGFLNIHFKLNADISGLMTNTVKLLRSSDCLKVNNLTTFPFQLDLPTSTRNFSIRFHKLSGLSTYSYKIYDDDSNMPLACAGCNTTFITPVFFGFGAPHKAVFTLRVNDNLNSYFVSTALDIQGQNSKTPVLIVPGVLGTDIKKGDDKLWANVLKMAEDFNDQFLDPLQFQSDLTPLDHSLTLGNLVKEPFPGTHFYDLIIQEFINQGYTEGQDLFTFPYDWRYGISQNNIDSLKSKIESIRNGGKVDIIAHSTGGLLLKKYVMDNPNDHHINKAVFVGVPNTGAPKAVKVFVQGDGFGIPWLADGEMQKISQNLPIVYDLAPSQKYYNNKGSYYKIIKQKFLARDEEKDLNQTETIDWLVNNRGMNQGAYNNASNLHTLDFDNFDLRTKGVELYNIVGCKSGTIGKVVEKNKGKTLFGNPIIEYLKPEEIPGDGTVPLESATNLPVDSDKKFYALNADHSKMVSQNGIRQKIVNIIAGSNLDTDNKITQDITNCKLNGKAISIYSPLNIEVFDQYGNRLGFASDGSLQNNIPEADFNAFGDHKFVYLPKDEGETYSINLQGTGQGTFVLGIDDIDDNSITQTQNFISVPVSTSTLGTLNLNSPQVSLSLDTNGDGSVDEVVHPSSILDQNQAQDLVAPVSSSTLSGIMGQEGYYRGDVNINLSAVDPVIAGYELETSGMLQLNYRIDDGEWQTSTSNLSPVPVAPISIVSGTGQASILPSPGEEVKQTLTFTAEGAHTVSFYAVDRAGNNELLQTITFTIDKTSPELSFVFDPNINDLAFTAKDNISTTSAITLLDLDNIITAKDHAGNSIELKFKEKDRKKKLKAELLSLSYNNQTVDTNKTTLKFAWENEHRALSQHIKSKKDFNIEAEYKVKTNQTKLEGKDQNGKIKKTLPGLVLLTVTTNKGDLEWGY